MTAPTPELRDAAEALPTDSQLTAAINAKIMYGEEPYGTVCDYIDNCEEVDRMGAYERNLTNERQKWTDAVLTAIYRAFALASNPAPSGGGWEEAYETFRGRYMMTPLQLEILLWYHCRAEDYRRGDFSAPAVRDTIDQFRDHERLIENNPRESRTAGDERCYRLTPRAEAYLKRVLEVPLPTAVWVFE